MPFLNMTNSTSLDYTLKDCGSALMDCSWSQSSHLYPQECTSATRYSFEHCPYQDIHLNTTHDMDVGKHMSATCYGLLHEGSISSCNNSLSSALTPTSSSSSTPGVGVILEKTHSYYVNSLHNCTWQLKNFYSDHKGTLQ